MNVRGYVRAMGTKRLLEAILISVFLLFFYGPLMNTVMIAFADNYNYVENPGFLPKIFSLTWWKFVLSQNNLVSSIGLSFFVATVVTIGSLCICLPAAYAFARINFPLKPFFQFSFLFANAFPRMGLYVSIAIIFYKLNLMGTFPGVFFIHLLGTLMYMTWIPAGAFRSVHAHQEEAARDVGATPFQTFRRHHPAARRARHPGRVRFHLPDVDGGSAGHPAGGSPQLQDHPRGHVRHHLRLPVDRWRRVRGDSRDADHRPPHRFPQVRRCRRLGVRLQDEVSQENTMPDKPKLQLVGMTKLYRNGEGVRGIDLEVAEAELVTLLGPSGCGKTTILRTVGGFLTADEGQVILSGRDITRLPPRSGRRPWCSRTTTSGRT